MFQRRQTAHVHERARVQRAAIGEHDDRATTRLAQPHRELSHLHVAFVRSARGRAAEADARVEGASGDHHATAGRGQEETSSGQQHSEHHTGNSCQ